MDKGHPKSILNQVSQHDGFKQGFFEAEHTSLSKKVLSEV
jgi:hypothetical protein